MLKKHKSMQWKQTVPEWHLCAHLVFLPESRLMSRRLHWVYVCVFLQSPTCMSVLPDQCVHRTLFQHRRASPLSQHKGRWETSWEERGGEIWSDGKSSRMHVFPSSFKEWQSERYRIYGQWEEGENDGQTKIKVRERDSVLSDISSPLCAFEGSKAHYLFIVSW